MIKTAAEGKMAENREVSVDGSSVSILAKVSSTRLTRAVDDGELESSSGVVPSVEVAGGIRVFSSVAPAIPVARCSSLSPSSSALFLVVTFAPTCSPTLDTQLNLCIYFTS